jgi:hypothetical protein
MRPQQIGQQFGLCFVCFVSFEIGVSEMEFVVTSGGLPVGAYGAEFIGAEPYNENADKFGPGVALKFRVVGGQHDGQEVSRICGAKLSQKSALAKFAVALKGAAIEAGERINFDNFKGARGSIIVQPTESGGTRIESFLKV